MTNPVCPACERDLPLTSSGLCEECSAHEPEPEDEFLDLVSFEDDPSEGSFL